MDGKGALSEGRICWKPHATTEIDPGKLGFAQHSRLSMELEYKG